MQVITRPIFVSHLIGRYKYETNTNRIIEIFGKEIPEGKNFLQHLEEDLQDSYKAMEITVQARNREHVPEALKIFTDILKPTPEFYFAIHSEEKNTITFFVIYKDEDE